MIVSSLPLRIYSTFENPLGGHVPALRVQTVLTISLLLLNDRSKHHIPFPQHTVPIKKFTFFETKFQEPPLTSMKADVSVFIFRVQVFLFIVSVFLRFKQSGGLL